MQKVERYLSACCGLLTYTESQTICHVFWLSFDCSAIHRTLPGEITYQSSGTGKIFSSEISAILSPARLPAIGYLTRAGFVNASK